MLPTRQGKRIAGYVLSALSESKDLNQDGLTEMKLSEMLQTQFRCPERYRRYLGSSLLAGGVAFGAIEKKGRKYFLGEVTPQFREHRSRRRRRGRGRKGRSRSRGGRRGRRRGSNNAAAGQTHNRIHLN